MKNFLLSIFAVLFAFAGAQAGEYTYTFSAKQFTANGTITLGNVDWTLAGDGGFWGHDGTKGQQFGSGSKPYKTLTLSTSGISGTITKIVVNTSGASSINASFTVSVGGTQYGSSTKLTTSATDYTFTGTASGDIALSYTQTSSKAIYIKSITVTYETGEGGGETPEPEPEEPKVGYTLVTSINDLSAGDNVVIVATDANVALSTTQNSNNRGQATVAKSENIVTFGDDVQVMTLEAGSVSGTFAFNTGNGYLYAASSGSNYLRTEATLSANSSWNITIASTGVATIKAQGSNTRNWLRYNSSSSIFSCYGSGQGDVSIYKLYEEGETPAETVDAPVLPESTTFEGSMLVEITGIATDATVYYTTDESDPATSDTRVEYTEPFTITETTTVKAVAINEVGASEVVTKIYTLFVVEETEGYYIKVVSEPTDWSGKYLIVYEDGTDAYVFNGKDQNFGYVLATTDGDVIKANSEVDAVAVTVAAMEGGYSISTVSGYMYKTAYSNGIDFGETAKAANTFEIAEDGVVITSGNNDDKTTFRYNKAVDQMRFRYYKSGQQPVQLYKYVEELPLYQTLTVTEAGYATLFLGFNARIPSAVEAYTVTTVNDGWVSLTQVRGVLPANTGVIIKAPAGEYKLFNEATATADVTGNLLEGTLFNKNIDEEAYVLGIVDGEVGLYKAAMAGGVWLNNANKAYLPASKVPNKSVAFYGFDWDGTTGIEKVEIGNEKSEIYDLTGRRVEEITAPGIYIVGGKKVLVK